MPRENGGPRLRRGAAGRWEIHWIDRGRSRRRSTGQTDLQFAQKVLANFILLDGREKARADGDGPLMVRDALGDPDDATGRDYWHEHVMTKVVDKETPRYSYVKLIEHFGHLAVKDITPEDVRGYVDRRRDGRLGKPSVNHTISRELSVLNAAINHAVREKRLPAAEKPFIEMPGKSVARDRWLSETEADRLLAAAAITQTGPGSKSTRLPRVYRFVLLGLNTASRKCALLEMMWDQIDLVERKLYLNPKGRAQTNKRRPSLPISDELQPVLERAHAERISDYVLDHPGSIRTAFENAVDRAGLGPDVTPHVLRHTWATWSAQGGTSMFDIAGVLGDTVNTVIATYAHHAPEHLRKAINSARPSRRPELRIVA